MANSEHVEILKQGAKIWNEWRQENSAIIPDLRNADLSGVDLSGVDLFRAKLTGAHLNEANLSRAIMSRAKLGGTHLEGANLFRAQLNWAYMDGGRMEGANLNEANLSWADLNEAHLDGADLSRAILMKTNLNGTNFTKSIFGFTVFGDVDLSLTKGLDSVVHRGPSTIGIDTIYRSQGKIPEIFLRGCGVPDTMTDYIPSLTLQPLQFYSCFISYSHADKTFARRLHDTLQGRGIRCWLDEHQVLPGDEIYSAVDEGIRIWDKVLLCCSKSSLSSWWVDNEIASAFKKEQRLWKERGKKTLTLIPLDIDGYMFTDGWENGKAVQVKERYAPSFIGWEKDNSIFEAAMKKVIKALQTEGGREKPPVPAL